MSFPLDPDAQDAALDALLSRDVSGIPTAWEIAIYDGDPRDVGSAELGPDGGYTRVVVGADMTDWLAASGNLKQSVEIALPTPSGPWSDTGTHWVAISAADHTTRWWFGLLAEPLDVDGTETALATSLAASWNTVGQL